MELSTVIFDVADNIATITLDRPNELNSFNNAMASDMGQIWTTIRDTDAIHVAIIQANGERAFCTGVDTKSPDLWFQKGNVWNSFDPGESLSPKFRHKVWKPVIVAVHGFCAGGGQYFVNEADIVICSDDATFFDPHANVGIVSALEPMGMLHRGIPLGDVLRWALMGTEERITADTALRIGLVTEVVPRADLRARAHDIAASIAARNPKAIQGTIRAIWESLDMNRTTSLQNGLAYTHIGNDPVSDRPARKNQPPTLR